MSQRLSYYINFQPPSSEPDPISGKAASSLHHAAPNFKATKINTMCEFHLPHPTEVQNILTGVKFRTTKNNLGPLAMALGTMVLICLRKITGQTGGLGGLTPPSAQGLILETQALSPASAPCMEPASPSACVSASLSLSM